MGKLRFPCCTGRRLHELALRSAVGRLVSLRVRLRRDRRLTITKLPTGRRTAGGATLRLRIGQCRIEVIGIKIVVVHHTFPPVGAAVIRATVVRPTARVRGLATLRIIVRAVAFAARTNSPVTLS